MTEPKKAPDLCEDRAWLDAFRRGEARAVERAFRTYAGFVTAKVRAGVVAADGTVLGFGQGGWDEVRDIVQETFARALSPEGRARYDGIHPYASFLSGVCRNVLLEHLRRRGTLQKEADSDAHETSGPWTPTDPLPDTRALSAEKQEAVRAFLLTLSDFEKKVVTVRFEDGLSQRDAAEVLGVTRAKVRGVEGEVVARFRAFLASKGLEE